mgnify:CR=1 FL=1
MYSVIKYQDLEFNSEPLFQPIAAYKSSEKVVEMTGIEPATP